MSPDLEDLTAPRAQRAVVRRRHGALCAAAMLVALASAACSGEATPKDEDRSPAEADDDATDDDDDATEKPALRDASAGPTRPLDAGGKLDAARPIDRGRDGAATADAAAASDSGPAPSSELPPIATTPIAPPVADDCITKVEAGDHKFTCDGVTYLVLVDEKCTKFACGLIFDVHGATMSGPQQRDNTLLHKLAPPAGYIYVNPSATASNTGGTWDLEADPPKVSDFFLRAIKAFHVDPARIHFTGFSQGGIMTFWFMQKHNDLLASTAPVAGARPIDWATDAWKPRVPTLVMNGISDTASTIERSRTLIETLVSGLKLMGGEQVGGDGHWTRKRWTGELGMELEYIEHDYGGQAVLGGHCIPGGVDKPGAANNFSLNATTCTTGDIKLNWGEIALKWFQEHPKRPQP